MWEKDRQLILAFRECFANIQQSMKDGEEVDLKTVCVEESEALLSHTLKSISHYKDQHPSELKDVIQTFYTPRIPYIQNL